MEHLPLLHKPVSPPTLPSDISSKRLKILEKGFLVAVSISSSDVKIAEKPYGIQTQGWFHKNWLSLQWRAALSMGEVCRKCLKDCGQ